TPKKMALISTTNSFINIIVDEDVLPLETKQNINYMWKMKIFTLKRMLLEILGEPYDFV
ncbi:7201_t:CDS:1, partial [Dentiscutata erythropus]